MPSNFPDGIGFCPRCDQPQYGFGLCGDCQYELEHEEEEEDGER